MFADRLNLLFERARLQGHPLSNEDIERMTHGAITANHIWRLRNGRNPNPTLTTVQALAEVFGVALDYFAGDVEESDDPAIRRALAQPELRGLVARLGSSTIGPRDAARLAGILDVFLQDEPGCRA